MNNLSKENVVSCAVEFSEFGKREELEAKLKIAEGEMIEEVEVSCDVADTFWPMRSEHFIICGDSLDSIREKAVKLFCGIYVNLLLEVAHSDLTVAILTEKEESLELDFEELDLSL